MDEEKIYKAIDAAERALCEQKLTVNEYKYALEELTRRLECKTGMSIVTLEP